MTLHGEVMELTHPSTCPRFTSTWPGKLNGEAALVRGLRLTPLERHRTLVSRLLPLPQLAATELLLVRELLLELGGVVVVREHPAHNQLRPIPLALLDLGGKDHGDIHGEFAQLGDVPIKVGVVVLGERFPAGGGGRIHELVEFGVVE